MKVLHIITGLENGGAEGVLFRLCTTDKDYQHEVVSLTGPGKYGALLTEHGIPVTCLGLSRSLIRGVFKSGRLFRLIKSRSPDVVQTWMYHSDLLGGLLARLAGCRNVVWNIRHSELVPGKSSGLTIWVARLCARLSSVIPRKIICCASVAQSVHEGLGYERSRMKVVFNGYDTHWFRPDLASGQSFRRELDLDPDGLVLGMVGRFNEQKDHAGLLASLCRLKTEGYRFTCLLAGAGVYSDNLVLVEQLKANGLSSEVVLLGERSDIPDLMNAIDVHILSSSFGEGFPNVVAEAMACGTPCVCTDTGDAAEIVGGTGWIVPPSNTGALTDAIVLAIEEIQTRPEQWVKRKHAAASRISNNFSLQAMVEAYHQVWG